MYTRVQYSISERGHPHTKIWPHRTLYTCTVAPYLINNFADNLSLNNSSRMLMADSCHSDVVARTTNANTFERIACNVRWCAIQTE